MVTKIHGDGDKFSLPPQIETDLLGYEASEEHIHDRFHARFFF